ncbi:hypothetical protein FACS1894105_12250 [Clostridia bacterium]|nr:hypothetical protein FACS1894105_12250 [Clostridia bacterium]
MPEYFHKKHTKSESNGANSVKYVCQNTTIIADGKTKGKKYAFFTTGNFSPKYTISCAITYDKTITDATAAAMNFNVFITAFWKLGFCIICMKLSNQTNFCENAFSTKA